MHFGETASVDAVPGMGRTAKLPRFGDRRNRQFGLDRRLDRSGYRGRGHPTSFGLHRGAEPGRDNRPQRLGGMASKAGSAAPSRPQLGDVLAPLERSRTGGWASRPRPQARRAREPVPAAKPMPLPRPGRAPDHGHGAPAAESQLSRVAALVVAFAGGLRDG